jgi:hypothetical protein
LGVASRLQLQPETMRTTPVLAILLVSSTGSANTQKDLGPTEVRTHLATADAAIAQCYVATVGEGVGGRLDVTLTIHRKGIIDHVDVRAHGVAAKLVTKIDACVRTALEGVTFPSRKVGTTAVIPYVWQKTVAAGAGPQESCWNPKGCKTTNDAPSTATKPTKPKSITTTHQARRAPRG